MKIKNNKLKVASIVGILLGLISLITVYIFITIKSNAIESWIKEHNNKNLSAYRLKDIYYNVKPEDISCSVSFSDLKIRCNLDNLKIGMFQGKKRENLIAVSSASVLLSPILKNKEKYSNLIDFNIDFYKVSPVGMLKDVLENKATNKNDSNSNIKSLTDSIYNNLFPLDFKLKMKILTNKNIKDSYIDFYISNRTLAIKSIANLTLQQSTSPVSVTLNKKGEIVHDVNTSSSQIYKTFTFNKGQMIADVKSFKIAIKNKVILELLYNIYILNTSIHPDHIREINMNLVNNDTARVLNFKEFKKAYFSRLSATSQMNKNVFKKIKDILNHKKSTLIITLTPKKNLTIQELLILNMQYRIDPHFKDKTLNKYFNISYQTLGEK